MRGLGRLFDDVISQQLANPPDLVIQSRLKVIFFLKIKMTKKGQRTLGNRLVHALACKKTSLHMTLYPTLFH